MGLQRKILYSIVVIITFANATFAREEWIDPHDMNIEVTRQTREGNKNVDSGGRTLCNCNQNFSRDRTSFHLRKVIRLITGMTYFDRKSEVYKGVIDIHLNTEDYDFLRNILSDQLNDEHVLKRLDEVLDKSLEKSIYSIYFFSILEYLSLIIYNETTQLTLALLGVLYVLWRIQPHNYKLTTLFKLFFPMVYISDFILRYRAKLEEAEIDKYLQFESYEGCDPDRLSWFDWLYDKFTGYCKSNKRTFLLSQRASIHIFTPLSIISDQFDVFITVLKHLGTGFGSFMWAMIEHMPWYIKPFVGLLSFLLVIFMLLMLGSYTLGIYPKFNMFYILQFECRAEHSIQNNRNQTLEDRISGNNLRVLLNSRSQDSLIAGTNVQKNHTPITYKTKQKAKKRISKPVSLNNQKMLAVTNDKSANQQEKDYPER